LNRSDSDAMRARYSTRIYAAGVLIAILTAIPIVDLIAPFFGSALMAHLFKRLSHEERAR
jgi:CysZ protein